MSASTKPTGEKTVKNKPIEKKNSGGGQCTFEVNVKYKQNSTWQGHIHWIEKDQKQNFRSVLEMLKLMDEAHNEEANIKTISWGAK